jgi:hypothetical protein
MMRKNEVVIMYVVIKEKNGDINLKKSEKKNVKNYIIYVIVFMFVQYN